MAQEKICTQFTMEGIFTIAGRNLPLKAVGWGVAAIAAVPFLGLFVFNQLGSGPSPLPEKSKSIYAHISR